MEVESIFLDFFGVGIEISSRFRSILELISSHLKKHLATPECNPCVKIQILEQLDRFPIPGQARMVYRYWTLRVFLLNGRYYFTDYLSYLIVEPGGRSAKLYFSPLTLKENGKSFFLNIFLNISLFEILRHHNLFFLHTAALESPDGEGYLFLGEALSGKTTITLYLVRSGFKYLSDDTVFIKVTEGDVRLLPFRKDFHIPREQFDRLSLQVNVKGEVGFHKKLTVDPSELFPDSKIEEMINPKWIFFINRTAGAKTQIKPVSHTEALVAIVRNSPTVVVNKELSKDHLKALRLLVENANTFELTNGDNWLLEPRVLLESIYSGTKNTQPVDLKNEHIQNRA